MSIEKKFYSLDFKSIDISDFFKNLHILSEEGTLIFINPDNYIVNELKDLHLTNNLGDTELKKYQTSSSDTIIRIRYTENLKKIFLNTEDEYLNKHISFEHFLYFGKDKNFLIQWIGAGKYTSIHLSFEFISDNIMRKFCQSLYLNNYHVQFFSYAELDSRLQ